MVWYLLMKIFLLMYQSRTDIDEAMETSFLRVRTDRVFESSHGNMTEDKKIQFKAQKLVVSCWSQYASPEDGDA